MHDDDQTSDDASTKPALEMGRRQLLSGAIIAAAAMPFTSCAADASDGALAAQTPDPTPTPTPTSTGGGGGGGPAAPAAVPYVQTETWNEPWVWRPSDWPSDTLGLNVIENQNPGAVIGFGNPNHVLFSYGGSTPGPTIRMSGDEILAVTLRNVLGPDQGITYVGPYPDPGGITGYFGGSPLDTATAQRLATELGNKRHDFCLGEHTNGIHTVHTTNLHTHGLHVRPGRNPDDTHSDNIFLRVLPQLDLARRQAVATDDASDIVCNFLRAGDRTNFLRESEHSGKAEYEFRLGDVQGRRDQPHPPGTHWYHPHSHGGTADQVTSGMAGFLIVEGDVDEAIRATLIPEEAPHAADPSLKSGPNDYRERLMFIQRVLNIPTDPDGARQNLQNNKRSASEPTNGVPDPATLLMRPGAVERWRVLNGSVDGKGYRRIMVLRGRFSTNAQDRLIRVDENGQPTVDPDGSPEPPLKRGEIDSLKVDLHQLSFDGVTLVNADGDYFLKDLAMQGQGAPSPLDQLPDTNWAANIERYAACFADGDSLRNCYVRPNEVYLGPANRTDLIFQAPDVASDDRFVDYTIIALGVLLHADTPLFSYQQEVEPPYSRELDGTPKQNKPQAPTGPGDVVIGRLRVTGDPCPAFDVRTIGAALPAAPPYLQPINDDDPKLLAPGGGFRTRTVTYSGWGGSGMPLIDCNVSVDADGVADDDDDDNETPTASAFAEFVRANPELEGLRYARRFDAPINGQQAFVLLAPNTRTMAIDGKKFDPMDPERPRMFLDSAEEWAIYNNSDFLWADTTESALAPNQYSSHYPGVPLTLAEGLGLDGDDPLQLLTRAVDHPFHMHQNPFWVMRIDVPDVNGELHNILEEPRWQDVVPIPRHRGRVVFRSRFDDFVGTYVNHCHLLQHEDNGMMQPVEVVPFDQSSDLDSVGDPEVARANYVVRDRLAQGGFSDAATNATSELYPQPTLTDSYLANMSFVDANPTGQIYPGFDVEPPKR